MKLSHHSQQRLEQTIHKALCKYPCGGEQPAVTDIYFQPNQTLGELQIFNDEDSELAEVIIEEWAAYDGADFYADVERAIRAALHRLKENGSIDKAGILQPYSFVLVDEEKETVAELLMVDDDIAIVNDELLKGLDKELDDFLKTLLDA